MPAKWVRLELLQVPAPGMLMATAAKKHLTIFRRSRRAPGAGRPEVKAAFTEVAHTTGGEPLRPKRNVIMKEGMLAKKLATGIIYKRSRSRYSPLAGKFYKLSVGETVSTALAKKSLKDILVESKE
jgi:hypothetical protein